MNWKACFSLCLCVGLAVQAWATEPFIIKHIGTKQPLVFLTFDDGPRPGITPKLNDILQDYDAKASFFFVASQIELYPNLAKEVYRDGHTVGNHSYSHVHLEQKNEQFIIKDIAKSQVVFYNNLGFLPSLFRSPYGKYELTDTYKSHFKYMIHWTIDPRDWDETQSERDIIKHILKHLKPGAIILLHENKKTVKLLPKLLKKLKKKGYRCLSLDAAIRGSNLPNPKVMQFWGDFQKSYTDL